MAREKEKKPGKVDNISFRAAEGGLVSEMTKKYDRGGQGGGPEYDVEHATAIHKSMASAKKHLEKHMSHAFGGEEQSQGPEGEREGEEY